MASKLAKIDFHVHPYFEGYDALSIVEAMERNRIDVVGLAGFNRDIFDIVRWQFNDLSMQFKVESDSLAIRLTRGSEEGYILRVGEYESREGFHLLVFGKQRGIRAGEEIRRNIDSALSDSSLIAIDHPLVAPNYADINAEREDFLFNLCEQYSNKIALEWNGYCIPELREGINTALLPVRLAGRDIRFGDVNQQLEVFEERLEIEKINCPMIADSDLHARFPRDLEWIGTANIEARIDGTSGLSLQKSLKDRIFAHDYSLEEGYVSKTHFIFSYGLPVIMGRIGNRLRETIRPRG